MKDYNVEDRLITKDDWEQCLNKKDQKKQVKKKENVTMKFEVEWHPYPKESPPEEDDYLVTVRGYPNPFIHYLHYSSYTTGKGSQWTHVTAWMDKPEPYKEEKNNG